MFTKIQISSLFLAAALLAAPTTSVLAQAQWQWTDAQGRKVYSDQPPPMSIPDKNIARRPTRAGFSNPQSSSSPADDKTDLDKAANNDSKTTDAPTATKKTEASALDKELAAKKQHAEAAEAAKRKQEEEKLAKQRAENCAIAQRSKATMDSGMRVAQVDKNGERIVLDDQMRETEMKRIQKVIQSECK